jgi:hypothetical protein
MGQGESTRTGAPTMIFSHLDPGASSFLRMTVSCPTRSGTRCECEKQTLKPGFHCIGFKG